MGLLALKVWLNITILNYNTGKASERNQGKNLEAVVRKLV